MDNTKPVILLIIIFIIGVAAVYWVYQTQVRKSTEELLPIPSPIAEETSTPTPSPQVNIPRTPNVPAPSIQPAAGSNTIDIFLEEQ